MKLVLEMELELELELETLPSPPMGLHQSLHLSLSPPTPYYWI